MKVFFLPLLCAVALSVPSTRAQLMGPLTVSPGLTIPSGTLPWALDSLEGNPQLVPIHHSTVEVNNHTGANIAGSLAGSVFYKPKMTTELAGLHARTLLHDPKASIYIHMADTEDDKEGDGPSSNTATIALVRATPGKDRRVFSKVQFTQLTGKAKRAEGMVETTTDKMPGGWLKMTPTQPLQPGEYAVTPIFKVQNTFATVAYDFTLDPSGPPASDRIVPRVEP